MKRNREIQTTKHSGRHSSMQYIILHHTGGTTDFNAQVNYLANNPAEVSCHYVVGLSGEVAKISDDVYVTWHAGESEWGSLTEMNRYSIGIEVVSDGYNYTDVQRDKVKELIRYLAKRHGIQSQNILRHKDVSPGRKWDIGDNFWNNTFSFYSDYIASIMGTKYTPYLEEEISKGYEPIFTQHSGSEPISEQEVKELVEIRGARFERRVEGIINHKFGELKDYLKKKIKKKQIS